MTFAEYNTDENFKDNKSSLEELVRLGKSEGKTLDRIKNELSPAWQKSSKIGNIQTYYDNAPDRYKKGGYNGMPTSVQARKGIDEVNKADPEQAELHFEQKEPEPAKEEIKEETTVEEPAEEKLSTEKFDKTAERYYNEQKGMADRAEVDSLNKLADQSNYNWKQEFDTTSKMTDAYKHIDDKLVAQLPTFMLRRYVNGEFGDPKGADAKLRLAHFLVNGLESKLKGASNAAMTAAGRAPLFSDISSDYEKYQKTNLEQGLQNRWDKYKKETQAAIDMATKEGMAEQDARLAIEQLTRNQSLNTVWNMMDSNQKLYAMEVTKKIGDYLGKMDISELGDFIAGAAYEGKMDKDKVIAIGIAKLVEKAPDLINKIKDGDMKDAVMNLLGGDVVTAGLGSGDGGITDIPLGVGNEFKGDTSKKGSMKDNVLGFGNIDMDDATMQTYYSLNAERPEGITTELPGQEVIAQTLKDYPNKGVTDIVNKSGMQKAINAQFSEIDKLASKATTQFKKDGNLKAYQDRMKSLYDYRNKLQGVYRKFGYTPVPGHSIDGDYDKAFGNKEEKFRTKYQK